MSVLRGRPLVLLACLIGACAGPTHLAGPGHDAADGRTLYRCTDGSTVLVTSPASEADVIVVSVAGNPDLQEIRMRPVRAASGNKATDGRLIWWTKGDTGFLALDETASAPDQILLSDCVAQD
jgi:membrane-bound inhibitor of C-type lysozyme